jgi:hypothetical protein
VGLLFRRRRKIRFMVPSITATLKTFNRFLAKTGPVFSEVHDVHFDFSECTFLHPSALTVLGGLARMVESRGGRVSFDWRTCRHDVLLSLRRSQFAAAFDASEANVAPAESKHTIPYREQRELDAEGTVSYLSDRWLGRGWLDVSEPLREAIVGRVCEIYINAFDHGKSSIGVMACGRHYQSKRLISLSVADFGIGIPDNVRGFLKRPLLSDAEAMEWAFRRGTTTRPLSAPRGMGLDLLKEFVRVNAGRLEVLSGSGYARVSASGEVFEAADVAFPGTMVSIHLACDGARYVLASETSQKTLFSG